MLIKLEVDEVLSGGKKVVVDVYLFGSRKAITDEIRMPTTRKPKNTFRLCQHKRRKRATFKLKASPGSSALAESKSFPWAKSSEPGVVFSESVIS
jgi:hypothetical protein